MDTDCTTFLEWALPQLELRWPGFRKVRRQVCKRLAGRMRDLGLANFAAYRARLESDPVEWRILDECCHITISRFFRDKAIFEALRTRVLPDIAARAEREAYNVQVWSRSGTDSRTSSAHCLGRHDGSSGIAAFASPVHYIAFGA
jgi:chemotaxis protein methyltransferase CheR